MLLKTLTLNNFRQYKGRQEIKFSCDPEQNVTVILGDNTYGKTTLLQAFNWCLYGTVLLDNPQDLLNYDVVSSMPNGGSEEVMVEIALVHNGIDYTVTTSQVFTKVGGVTKGGKPERKVCYMQPDGQTEPVKANKVDSVISSILPEGLSNYFFFDTERVAAVSTRKDLADSVKGLLGLTVLENAIKHLGDKAHKRSALGKFYNALDEEGDSQASQALEKIQESHDRLAEAKERLEQCEEEIEQFRAKRDTLNEELSHRGSQEVKRLVADKARAEKEVKADEKLVEDGKKLILSDFGQESLKFFAAPLLDQAEALLSEAELDDKGIKDLGRPTLEDIIARGTCVCGCDLKEHPEAVEHIRYEMRFCPPESIGNAVRNYRQQIKSYKTDHNRVLMGISNRQANVYQARERIQNKNDEIDDMSRAIEKSDAKEIAKLERDRNAAKEQLKSLDAKRTNLIRDCKSFEDAIGKYKKIYDKLDVVSVKNKKAMKYIRYAEAIHEWLAVTYGEKESEVRESLEQRVNDMFNQMYHGTRRVVLTPKYEVKLLTSISEKEMVTGESEGLNRVKNFAFIAGLVSLAKEKIVSNAGEEEFDLSSEPYPLVMDAPFSNTDETHIANISRVLPEASEQVVMFVMNKDWRYAEKVLNQRVGSKYELDKQSEQYSILRGL